MAKRQWVGRIYLGEDQDGKQLYHWVGRFPRKSDRDDAVAEARAKQKAGKLPGQMTVNEWIDTWLARYEGGHKDSSYDTVRYSLSRLRRAFGARRIASVTRLEAMDWADGAPRSSVSTAIMVFNAAIDAEIPGVERNPFRGLAPRTRGRADKAPPTIDQLDTLVDACKVHGDYADQMRALIRFAAYTGMRPGEIMPLEWSDIDLDRMRILVSRRLYRGRLDVPKNGKAKLIALTPPARDALLGLASRQEGGLVFRSKRGKRLSGPVLSGYWGKVTARADMEDMELYLATKHFAVHYMWTQLNLSPRVIAAQMGWSLKSVMAMLAVYGHGEIGALEEVDAAFEGAEVRPLRAVPDADPDARAADGA